MANGKERSLLQENLVKLYLRLNGYFTTGFIVHSDCHGKNKTEIDVLAVRLPYNSEPEREVGPSVFIPIKEEKTNLLICEVKSIGQQLQFNDALRSHPKTMRSILQWSGLFKENETESLSESICETMNNQNQNTENIKCIDGPRNTSVIPLLSSPERINRRNNQPFFLHGNEIFSYIWRCMCPAENRICCSTNYDFTAWGREFFPIVNYFKSRIVDKGPGTIKELYKHLNISP